MHYKFGSKAWKAKIVEKITWHCCMCCNPAKRRVEFEDNWLIKSSFITKDEMKLTRTKIQPDYINRMIKLSVITLSSFNCMSLMKIEKTGKVGKVDNSYYFKLSLVLAKESAMCHSKIRIKFCIINKKSWMIQIFLLIRNTYALHFTNNS